MSRPRIFHSRALRAALAAGLLGAGLLAGSATARGAAFAPHEVVVGYRTAARHLSLGPVELATPRRWPPPARVPGRARVRIRVVHLPAGERVGAALRRLRARPGVAYAQPDYIAQAAGAFFPDDRGRSGLAHGWEKLQWNLLDGPGGVDAPQAWANLLAVHRPGGSRVRIAVLDTGVAYRDWHGFRESPDLRETRFVDPDDVIADNHFPLDRDGHGTFVASVIAESTNNQVGLTGLAYGATIMPVRVLSSDGEGDESTIAEGIRFAVAHHAQIINLSLEFVPDEVRSAGQIPQVVSAIRDARRHGVMVVAAAGNDQTRQLAYPARLSGVVSGGATTRDGCLANYSDGGAGLDVGAPGGGSDALQPADPACHPGRVLPSIYQLTLSDPPDWSRFGYPPSYIGTSMSAPQVSAAAALVIASGVIGPHPTSDQVLARLEQTATALPVGGHEPNPDYGWGLLNAGAATSPLAVTSGLP